MRKAELTSASELRKQFFNCVHQEAVQLERHCAEFLQTCDPISIQRMQGVLAAITACYEFLQLKKLLIYITSANAFISATQEILQSSIASPNQIEKLSVLQKTLVNMTILISSATELCSIGTRDGLQSAEYLLNVAAINRLRKFMHKKALADPCASFPQVSPYALLARYNLQACLTNEESLCAVGQERFSHEELAQEFSAGTLINSVSIQQRALAEAGLQLKLVLFSRQQLFSAQRAQADLQRLYNLAYSCDEVSSVAGLLSCKNTMMILTRLVQIIWISLRYARSKDADLSGRVHAALTLLMFSIEIETSHEFYRDSDHEHSRECRFGSDVGLRAAMRRVTDNFLTETVAVLERIVPAPFAVTTHDGSKESSELQDLFSRAFNEYSARLQALTAGVVVSDNREYVSSDLCMLVHKMAVDLQTLGHLSMYEKADALEKVLSIHMEQQWKLEPVLCDSLQKFQRALQDFCVAPGSTVAAGGTAKAPPEFGLDDISLALLRLEVASQLRCHTQVYDKHATAVSDTEAIREVAKLPMQLASSIRILPVAENELLKIFPALTEPTARWIPLIKKIAAELQLLVTGAHTLKVYRVEALSAVMLEVYQQALCSDTNAQDICRSPRWQSLVLRAHRNLRKMLNQAAAHQEVASARTIIAALYHWLESRPDVSARTQRMDRQETETLLSGIQRKTEKLLSVLNRCEAEETSSDSKTMFIKTNQEILHGLHTLKGNAACCELTTLAQICHEAESFFLSLATRLESGTAPQSRHRIRSLVQELTAAAEDAVQTAPPMQIAEATITRLPYNSKQNMIQRQVLLGGRDTAIPAVALQRLTHLTAGCLLSQQRIHRYLHTGNSRSGLVSAQLRELLSEQSERLQLIRQQLQSVQMTSLGRWRGRFDRLTGRLSNELNKQVRMRLLGDEIAIERILLEYLQAALEHLLRNAICHGVETVPTRRQLGKPETGTITVAVQETKDELLISVSDDGAGLDTQKLVARAVEMGINGVASLTQKELFALVFQPGFSTSSSLSLDAGRGLGLDIVEKSMAALGGRVEVTSVLHEGSSFRVILPRSQYNGGL